MAPPPAPSSCLPPGRLRAGFTLVELLVVVSIISLLLAILGPALSKAKRLAMTTKCLSNMRNMEVAHWMYMGEWNGAFIDVGLAHGGAHADEGVAWINTLRAYYGQKLLHRSPVDRSPHWPVSEGGVGVPITGTTDQFRRTSYGINNYLTRVCPTDNDPNTTNPSKPYNRLNQIQRPGSTVQFLIMAFTGDFAGADHPHVETWGAGANAPIRAAQQVQIDAHGGPAATLKGKSLLYSPQSVSNYGYLDGHAETNAFEAVYVDFTINRFDPAIAR